MNKFLCAFAGLVLYASAEQLEPIPAQDALGMFKVPDDVRVELVAAEPDVVDPVAIAFDERGRMYVVENRGYPTDESGKGIVALLEDPNGDGYYDKRTVFADGFDFPNGVMPWKGGVIVTCAPDLLFLKDTDGDGRADVRAVLLTGFAPGGSTQLRVSHPMLGVDNWIYLTNGLSGGEITNPSKPDLAAVKMGSLDGRYNPLTGVFETTAGQAQFGQAFDDFGNKFVCSNRKHIEMVMLQPGDLARNVHAGLNKTVAEIPDHGEAGRIFALSDAQTTAFAHAGTFTAACGIMVYRGDALPEHYRGNAFVCDPTAALVHRDILEPAGASLVAKRDTTEQEKDFFASPDNWCRPVFTANGADGALYVCDMYRKTIEHPVYLPEEIRGAADFEGGTQQGRIYRVIGKEVTRRARALDPADAASLYLALGDKNGWVADTAQRLLLEQGPLAEPLRNILKDEDSRDRARVAALYLLHASGQLTNADLEIAVEDESPSVREHALRMSRAHVKDGAKLADLALKLAADTDARVRFVAALALGDAKDARGTAALARIATTDIADPWTRDAALSSAGYDFAGFATAAIEQADKSAQELPEFVEVIARTLAVGSTPDVTTAFLEPVFPDANAVQPWQLAVLRGALDGVGSSQAYGDEPSALERLKAAAAKNASLQKHLDAAVTAALNTLQDGARPLEERVRAVEFLGFTNFDTAGEVLATLMGPIAPPELQIAAVQALANMHDDRVAGILATDAWGGFTAPVRSAATSALLATPQRTMAMLDAIERGAIPAWTIDPGARTNLQKHRDETIKAKSTALFAEVKTTDRKKVYEEYQDALSLAPNSVSGAQVFKDLCAQCHLFNDTGYAVGPDLTSIRSQPNEAVLMHILMPNWLLEQGFESYTVETADLETYSGIISSQNESNITLKCPLGVVKTIPRTDIVSIQTASKSLMPEELEKGMTKQQLRDLIGYLKGEE
ncbi:MAG: PVC-type heme-binding CxxCH protein [Candidatus Hydrogenedentes bacterium]|nr:PVC-type heme-binding CxxCH protein [Candidatus Hydrogenedentota bacterium]